MCFICFDGGDLVVCDRRGCPKVYHPACIKRDEAFFQSRSKWNCGWHICSSCEKPVHYMCYTCTFSVCKICIKQGKFFGVRGTKGFCDTCFGTIFLIESKDDDDTKVRVDFDDPNSWEYLFKLYWLDLKGKLSLTMEELTGAKSRWNAPITYARKEKDESSDDLYDANDDDGGGSRKRRCANSSRGRKRRKAHSNRTIAVENVEISTGDAGSLPKKEPSEGVLLPPDTKWASPELLEFVGHMRDGDQSFISQFDVQALLLDYIKKNDLRDPRRKSQIICDSRLHCLFRKTHVAHFEMLRLLEMHFLVSDASTVNNGSHVDIKPNSARIDASGYCEMTEKLSPHRKKRMHGKMEREPLANLNDYAAVDMHNMNLIYLRRSLMEDLIDDSAFPAKISGGFVRIKISGLGQKQDMYRLVKVIGTHKVSEKYSTGKKTTNFALEILNLNKKEIITMDTISNQDFTEEECKRLRQCMKCGLISRLKVGDVQEKAVIFQSVRVNDWLDNEKQRLGYLRDRASETGRRKDLRECVEKLQLLNSSQERARRINEVLEVHVDPHMDPDYESTEEMDYQKAVVRIVNGKKSDGFFSPVNQQNHAERISDAIRHPRNLSKQSTIRKVAAGRNSRKFHSAVGTDIPKSGTCINTKISEAASPSGVTLSSDMEPEKVWQYKDPLGNVQGPFTLLQLSKWTTYFPHDLRVWLIFESEERSLLLTEVLSKQPKDFGQAATVPSSKTTLAGSGQNRKRPNVDMNSALSPLGYSTLNSSEMMVKPAKCTVPERGSVNSLDDRFSVSGSSVPPKDACATTSRVQYQTKNSCFGPSPGSPYEQSNSHHDGVQGRCSGEWNNGHNRDGLWSPTMTQTSCSGQGNVESHDNQHDSKSSLKAGSAKDLRQDYSHTVPTQLTRRDVPSPVLASSPSESRTASSQYESSCFSSTTNPSVHDELHSYITSEKASNCAPVTFVEDRGSSSPSGMLSHSERVPICGTQSVPSMSISEMCKVGESKHMQKTLEADVSNASVNQSPQSKIFLDSSPDNQDTERECPSPTLRSESKEPAMDHSGPTPVAPETLDINKIPDYSPVANIPVKSEPPATEVGPTEHEYPSPTTRSESKELAVDHPGSTSVAPETLDIQRPDYSPVVNISLKADPPATEVGTREIGATGSIPNPEKTDLCGEDSNIQKEFCRESTLVASEKMVVGPASRAELIDVCDVSGSVSNLEKTDLRGKDSNIQKELYSESILVRSDKMMVKPASGVESIDVANVLESVSNLEKRDLSGEDSNVQKELVSESTLVMCEKMVAEPATCAEPIDVSGVLKPVFSLEKTDLKHEDSNIQKELHTEPIIGTRENIVVDPASCAESIHVTDVLESAPTLEKTDLEGEDSNIQKELQAESIIVTREKMVVDPASGAESIHAPDVLESVSNLEKTDLKGEDSNIQKEMFCEPTLDTSEKMIIDPASCAESIDVSDVLESVFNLERTNLKGEGSCIQKELHPKSIFLTRENMVVDPASCPESIPVSDVLESVSKETDLKGDYSNIQRDLHEVSTLVTRENMVVDLASCARSIDVPDVSGSLVPQSCGTTYMDAIAAIEDFMTTSPEEEPQCSSPIALSPWGEPGYYQGDAVDSTLWDVQDYPMNDVWSLLPPTPTLQHLSGEKTDGSVAHVTERVTVIQGDNELFQRGPTPGEENVELANAGASTAWGLNEQVRPKSTAVSVPSIDGSTGVFGWKPSAIDSESSNTPIAWTTSQNLNSSSSYATAAASVKTSQEPSRKKECPDLNVANLEEALGNTKSLKPSTGNANRGSQRNHHRDRYSEISESWLLSSNYSRSRSAGFRGGAASRTSPRGQTQRGICKFHQSGYCRKGSSCSYLHPSLQQ